MNNNNNNIPNSELSDLGLPDISLSDSPKNLGYYFPAEFAPHDAIWLSWPHKEAS